MVSICFKNQPITISNFKTKHPCFFVKRFNFVFCIHSGVQSSSPLHSCCHNSIQVVVIFTSKCSIRCRFFLFIQNAPSSCLTFYKSNYKPYNEIFRRQSLLLCLKFHILYLNHLHNAVIVFGFLCFYKDGLYEIRKKNNTTIKQLIECRDIIYFFAINFKLFHHPRVLYDNMTSILFASFG